MADKGKLPPFNDEECIYLLEQIKNYKIIESKKTDVGSLAAKKRAWEEINRNFNSTYYFQKDGDVVEMEDASAKRRKISMSEVTAAFKSAGSTLAGTILLEFIDGADIPTSSASKPLSFLTPDPLVPGSLSNTSPCIQFIPSLAQPPSSPLPPPPPLLNPKFTRQDVLQKTVHANEERAKISIQGDKELHCLLLAEAKLSHQEVKKSQQRAKERHRLNIQQAEELHCMEMERLRLKMEFEAEMHRETLQAAKEKHERENRHSEETRRAQLRNLQGPSEHTE